MAGYGGDMSIAKELQQQFRAQKNGGSRSTSGPKSRRGAGAAVSGTHRSYTSTAPASRSSVPRATGVGGYTMTNYKSNAGYASQASNTSASSTIQSSGTTARANPNIPSSIYTQQPFPGFGGNVGYGNDQTTSSHGTGIVATPNNQQGQLSLGATTSRTSLNKPSEPLQNVTNQPNPQKRSASVAIDDNTKRTRSGLSAFAQQAPAPRGVKHERRKSESSDVDMMEAGVVVERGTTAPLRRHGGLKESRWAQETEPVNTALPSRSYLEPMPRWTPTWAKDSAVKLAHIDKTDEVKQQAPALAQSRVGSSKHGGLGASRWS